MRICLLPKRAHSRIDEVPIPPWVENEIKSVYLGGNHLGLEMQPC